MIQGRGFRIPAAAAGEFFSPGSTFCADSYSGIRSTPVLPQQHVKDPGHSARTCAETAAVSCSTSHASAVSTALRWIFKKRAIKLVIPVEPHASAVSLLKRAENSAI